MSGLPDMYTRSPRAAGLRAKGVHIRQTRSGHSIRICCMPNPSDKQKPAVFALQVHNLIP